MDPRHAEDVARSAPRGEMRHYDGDHFEVYHRPLLRRPADRPDRVSAKAPPCRPRMNVCGSTIFGSSPSPAASPIATGHGAACARSGPITTCWRTSSSAAGRHREQSPSKWPGTEGRSTAPTPALPKRLAAGRTPAELIDDFAALIDRPHGLGRVFPRRLLLGDHVIHELDIVLPLGLAADRRRRAQ